MTKRGTRALASETERWNSIAAAIAAVLQEGLMPSLLKRLLLRLRATFQRGRMATRGPSSTFISGLYLLKTRSRSIPGRRPASGGCVRFS